MGDKFAINDCQITIKKKTQLSLRLSNYSKSKKQIFTV